MENSLLPPLLFCLFCFLPQSTWACPCRGRRSQRDATSTRRAEMLWMRGWSEAHRRLSKQKQVKNTQIKKHHSNQLKEHETINK